MVAVAWREGGKQRRSTRATMEKATEWAKNKVKELSLATGKVLISPTDAERLAWLHRLAGGPEECARLLGDMEAALKLLGPEGRLEEAARTFCGMGRKEMVDRRVWDAVAAFLLEYEQHHPRTTMKGVKYDLKPFQRAFGDLDMVVVVHCVNFW